MKYVYSASGSAEAHMVVHLLEQAGIKADIHGEALLGAVGGVPTAGLVKIAVADDDYDRARTLILEWEAKNPPEKKPVTSSESRSRSSIPALCAAALAGAVCGWLANEQGLVTGFTTTADHNRDGKPDQIWHYSSENAVFPSRSEIDLNFDGAFDIISRFDAQGTIVSDRADYNFDGIFETVTFYKHGQTVRSEADTDGDGKADHISLFEHGILVQERILNPETGKPVRINHYKNLMLSSADFDSDGDGVLETHYTYDRYERVIDTQIK